MPNIAHRSKLCFRGGEPGAADPHRRAVLAGPHAYRRVLASTATRRHGPAAGLTASEYTVIMNLSEAPNRQLRMADLAIATGLSASRTTRLVDALQSHGLVSKRASSADGRSNLAELTSLGLTKLRAAWPVHVTSVRRRVLDHVPPGTLAKTAQALEAVAAQLQEGAPAAREVAPALPGWRPRRCQGLGQQVPQPSGGRVGWHRCERLGRDRPGPGASPDCQAAQARTEPDQGLGYQCPAQPAFDKVEHCGGVINLEGVVGLGPPRQERLVGQGTDAKPIGYPTSYWWAKPARSTAWSWRSSIDPVYC